MLLLYLCFFVGLLHVLGWFFYSGCFTNLMALFGALVLLMIIFSLAH